MTCLGEAGKAALQKLTRWRKGAEGAGRRGSLD